VAPYPNSKIENWQKMANLTNKKGEFAFAPPPIRGRTHNFIWFRWGWQLLL
jgi:hypothetical protein